MAKRSFRELDGQYDVAPYLGAIQQLRVEAARVEERAVASNNLLGVAVATLTMSVGVGASPVQIAAAAGVAAVAVGRAYWYSYLEKDRLDRQMADALSGADVLGVPVGEADCALVGEWLRAGEPEKVLGLLAKKPEIATFIPETEFSALAHAIAADDEIVCDRLIGLGADVEAPIRAGSVYTAHGMAAQVLERDGESTAAKMVMAGVDPAISLGALEARLTALGVQSWRNPVEGQCNSGKVIAESSFYLAQNVGRGAVVVHDRQLLDKSVREGDDMTVVYRQGRGQVAQRAPQEIER